jgi:hypothetical protein
MAIWLLLLTYNGKTDLGQNEEIKDCGGTSTGEEAQGRGEGEAEHVAVEGIEETSARWFFL